MPSKMWIEGPEPIEVEVLRSTPDGGAIIRKNGDYDYIRPSALLHASAEGARRGHLISEAAKLRKRIKGLEEGVEDCQISLAHFQRREASYRREIAGLQLELLQIEARLVV